MTTAVIAPPKASVPRVQAGDAQRADRRDDDEASRIRKPAVPAVAGSMRRNRVGAVKRPRSRASAQPRMTITTAAATRTGVSTPKIRSRSM